MDLFRAIIIVEIIPYRSLLALIIECIMPADI